MSFLQPALRGASSLPNAGLTVRCLFFSLPRGHQVPGTAEPRLHLPGVTPTRCSSSPSLETPSPRWRRCRLPSSPACPALLGPRANLGSGRATPARLGFQHLLLRALAPRLRAGGAAAASAVRSRRRGADAPGSSSLHFNSWPLWPLHTEREAACRSRRVRDALYRCSGVCGLVGEAWSGCRLFGGGGGGGGVCR